MKNRNLIREWAQRNTESNGCIGELFTRVNTLIVEEWCLWDSLAKADLLSDEQALEQLLPKFGEQGQHGLARKFITHRLNAIRARKKDELAEAVAQDREANAIIFLKELQWR